MRNKIFLAVLMSSVLAVNGVSINAATTVANTGTATNSKTTTSNLKTADMKKPEMEKKDIELAENQKMVTGKVASITSTSIKFYEGTDQMGGKPNGQADGNEMTPPAKGEAPANMGQGGGMNITWADTTQTLKLSSTVTISQMGGPKASEALTYADIKVDDQVRMIVETGTDGTTKTVISIEVMNGMGGQGSSMSGSDTGSIQGSALYLVDGKTETTASKTYAATKEDESAVKVTNGGSAVLTKATITKTGNSSDTTESDFYGLNAAILATKNSTISLSDATITTNAEGSNAVFATQEGSKVNLKNVNIVTKANASRGLDATYQGTITATNVNITTSGAHCAALATDRGEGTVSLTGGTLKTAGDGSPCIYSTGNISVANATGISTGAQAAVIEGKNSITLKDTTLTGAGKCGVMLYQSFSGDAGVGTSVFNMTGGKLTATAGPIFFVTNTDAIVNLKNATLSGTAELISAGEDRWGSEGSNGGNLTFNADSQELEGDIIADSISTVAVNLTNGSTLEGAINSENTAKSMSLSLDKESSWNVTGDSYLTVIKDTDTSLENIDDNGFTIYYDSTQTDNAWLNGKTMTLTDGGKLTPIK